MKYRPPPGSLSAVGSGTCGPDRASRLLWCPRQLPGRRRSRVSARWWPDAAAAVLGLGGECPPAGRRSGRPRRFIIQDKLVRSIGPDRPAWRLADRLVSANARGHRLEPRRRLRRRPPASQSKSATHGSQQTMDRRGQAASHRGRSCIPNRTGAKPFCRRKRGPRRGMWTKALPGTRRCTGEPRPAAGETFSQGQAWTVAETSTGAGRCFKYRPPLALGSGWIEHVRSRSGADC